MRNISPFCKYIYENFSLIRESFSLIRESFPFIREKYVFFPTKMSSMGFRRIHYSIYKGLDWKNNMADISRGGGVENGAGLK